MLYDGFFNPADKTAMKIIRETDPECLSTLDISFDDERISKLLFRYRARNFPWTLNGPEQQQWANHCLKIQQLFLEILYCYNLCRRLL